VEATGAHTVTYFFHTKPGLGQWQTTVAMAPVLPKHYWEPVVQQALAQPDPAAWLYDHVPNNEPVLGPFKLGKWVPGSYVELVPNPQYYFHGLEVTEYENGAYQETLPGEYTFSAYGTPGGTVSLSLTVGPHVGSVWYGIYPSQEAAFRALLDGHVDLVLNPLGMSQELRDSLEIAPNITTVLNQDYGMYYMAFNMRTPPMDILEFRQAVATLIDRDSFSQIEPGAIDPLWSVMPEGNAFWHNPAAPRIGQGLTRQERISDTVDLLTTAGFTWTVEPGWDPVGEQVIPGTGLHYGGAPVPEFELLAPNFDYDPVRATEALSIEHWLNEAGISVTAVLTDFSSMLGPVFEDASFDMYILGWSLGNVAFPSYFESFWHSRNDTATTGNSNTPGYNNPVYDALCDDFMTTSDIQQARADAFEMQVILGTDLPYVTLHSRNTFEGYLAGRLTLPYTETLGGLEDQSGMPPLVHVTNVPSGTLQLAVDLQGRSDDAGALFLARAGGGTVGACTSLSDGTCSIPLPGGTYTVTVQMPSYLGSVNAGVSVVAGADTALPVIQLRGGDTNGDCTVNILDLSRMGGRFGTACGDAEWDPLTDINDDCSLNVLDLTIAGGNFSRSCPTPWTEVYASEFATANAAQVGLEPSELTLSPGSTGVMTISVSGASGLYGAEVHLAFDPGVVEVVDADGGKPGVQVALGDLLSPDFVAVNSADNVSGIVDLALTQLAPTPTSDGEGALAMITFRGIATGTSTILFDSAILADPDGQPIAADVHGGTVNVGGERVHIYLPLVTRSWAQ
jgi:ABC-type transport system substrate-binding protein